MESSEIGIEVEKLNTLPKKDIVEKHFESHIEQDQFEFKRKIYKYENITFMFRGREEMPTTPTINESTNILIGSEPVQLSEEQFNTYRKETQKTDVEKDTTQNTNYIVTKDLEGVLQLVSILKPEDGEITSLLNEVKKGKYSGKSLDIVDKLMACNFIEEDNEKWLELPSSSDAETVAILSLLGDRDADVFIEKQLQKMANLDKKRKIQEKENVKDEAWLMSKYQLENIADVDKKVCVHATDYKPVFSKSGYEVKTLGDATDFKFLRNTVHVSLDHKVVSHTAGNWQERKYVIISPFKDMISINGKPIVTVEHDTYWGRNPGESLKFPNGILVEKGDTKNGELFMVNEPGHYIFKEKKFSTGNVLSIFENNFLPITDIQYSIVNSFSGEAIEGRWDEKHFFLQLSNKFLKDGLKPVENKNDAEFCILSSFDIADKLREFLLMGDKKTLVKNKIQFLLKELKTQETYKGEPNNLNKELELLANVITKNIEKVLSSKASEIAVNKAIENMGYIPKEGSAFNSPHPDSPLGFINRSHAYEVNKAKDVLGVDEDYQDILGEFNWNQYLPIEDGLDVCDDKIRRVIYVSGSLNSRENK